eukprot:scaffold78883_cov62-Phaeocystis_antarctica.AAC.4
MSLTSTVPLAVPSLDQSSWPWVPSSARKKKSLSLNKVSLLGFPLPDGLISLTMALAVPSLDQSSLPWVPSLAAKKKRDMSAPLALCCPWLYNKQQSACEARTRNRQQPLHLTHGRTHAYTQAQQHVIL